MQSSAVQCSAVQLPSQGEPYVLVISLALCLHVSQHALLLHLCGGLSDEGLTRLAVLSRLERISEGLPRGAHTMQEREDKSDENAEAVTCAIDTPLHYPGTYPRHRRRRVGAGGREAVAETVSEGSPVHGGMGVEQLSHIGVEEAHDLHKGKKEDQQRGRFLSGAREEGRGPILEYLDVLQDCWQKDMKCMKAAVGKMFWQVPLDRLSRLSCTLPGSSPDSRTP